MLLDKMGAERIVYLGIDDALDSLVWGWAQELVGEDPTDAGVWKRAAERCTEATADSIDRFIGAERARLRLKKLECLPRATARAVELFDGRLAVMLHDKALLDEEDILPATLLIFGKSPEPVIHRVGPRTFVSPGPIDGPAGVALAEDEPGGGIVLSMFDASGNARQRELLAVARTGKLRVTGAGSV